MIDNTIRLNPQDNVVVALREIAAGEDIVCGGDTICTARDNIPYGHKALDRDVRKNDRFIKFGEVIGFALEDIPQGSWVHGHNLGYREE